MTTPVYLTPDELHSSLTLRDLSDPAQGPHAMQTLLHGVVESLQQAWNCTVRTLKNPPIVSVRNNYDLLNYQGNNVTRAQRYTRYLSPTTMLRSHTSAELPAALKHYAGRAGSMKCSRCPAWCTGAMSLTAPTWANPTRLTCGASAPPRTPRTRTCWG